MSLLECTMRSFTTVSGRISATHRALEAHTRHSGIINFYVYDLIILWREIIRGTCELERAHRAAPEIWSMLVTIGRTPAPMEQWDQIPGATSCRLGSCTLTGVDGSSTKVQPHRDKAGLTGWGATSSCADDDEDENRKLQGQQCSSGGG